MRRFTDGQGRAWDVVLGRESWGSLLALFVPAAGNDGPVRQASLSASGYDAATQELNTIGDGALQALLERSQIKEEA